MPQSGTPQKKRKDSKSQKTKANNSKAKGSKARSAKTRSTAAKTTKARNSKGKKAKASTEHDHYALYDRMAQIHYLLREGAFPSYERLSAESGRSVRTAKRDIAFMRDQLSRPIASCRKRGGLYYTEPDVDFPFLKISEREIIAICLAQQFLEACQGTIYAAPLRSAFHKVICQLSKRFKYTPEQIAEAFSFAPFAVEPSCDPEMLATLASAILDQEEVEFDYANFREKQTKPRRVHPLHLRHHNSVWTLFSYDPSRRTLRSFVLSRAHKPRRTGVPFKKTKAHDWKRAMAHSIGTYRSGPVECVRLRLTPTAHQLLSERPIHPTQVVTALPDETVELTMTVAINPEVESAIRAWGSEVRVLEPQSLEDNITAHARQIVAWADEKLAARAKRNVAAGADSIATPSKSSSNGKGFVRNKASSNGRSKPLTLYKVPRSASLFRRKTTVSRKGAGSGHASGIHAKSQAELA